MCGRSRNEGEWYATHSARPLESSVIEQNQALHLPYLVGQQEHDLFREHLMMKGRQASSSTMRVWFGTRRRVDKR